MTDKDILNRFLIASHMGNGHRFVMDMRERAGLSYTYLNEYCCPVSKAIRSEATLEQLQAIEYSCMPYYITRVVDSALAELRCEQAKAWRQRERLRKAALH